MGILMNAGLKYFLVIPLLLANITTRSQQPGKYVRQGNRLYDKKKYVESETSYRRAQEKGKDTFIPSFNIGDALYKQGKYNDASMQFEALTERKLKNKDIAGVYHNLGNSMLNEKKYTESIEAYKNALRRNPGDMETKYNLAYAMRMLKQQQQKQKQNQDKNKQQNQDQKKDQDKNQNKDQNKDQNKEQKKDQDKKDQQKQGISREDAQRILQSLQNDEKKLLEKLKKQQAARSKKTTTKDW